MNENFNPGTADIVTMVNQGCDIAEIYDSTTTVSEAIEWMKQNLQPRDFEIVCMYCGLEGYTEMSYRDIGECIDLSGSRIGQIVEEVFNQVSLQEFSGITETEYSVNIPGFEDLSLELQVILTNKALKDRDEYCELLQSRLSDWPIRSVRGKDYCELSRYEKSLLAKQSDGVVREVASKLGINQSFESLISLLELIDSFKLGSFLEQVPNIDVVDLVVSWVERSQS